jgi:predicted CoA-binding protein
VTIDIGGLLKETSTIAVLGAHRDPTRAAHYVPAYLRQHGYRIVPVNPTLVGRELFGATVVASLADTHEPIDLVDVFRRSEDLPAHVPEILAMKPLPKTVWLQSGITHAAFAAELERHGIRTVQDRCLMVDHQRFVG